MAMNTSTFQSGDVTVAAAAASGYKAFCWAPQPNLVTSYEDRMTAINHQDVSRLPPLFGKQEPVFPDHAANGTSG